MNEEKTKKKSKSGFNALCISAITYHVIIAMVALAGLLNLNYLENAFALYNNNEPSLLSFTALMILLLGLNITSVIYLILLLSQQLKGIALYIVLLIANILVKTLSFSLNWYEISLLIVYVTLFTIASKKRNFQKPSHSPS